MIDVTYDPEADAVYFRIGQGRIDSTEEAGPLVYDLDAEGHILGIEVIGASRILAPGPWKDARLPGSSQADAAE